MPPGEIGPVRADFTIEEPANQLPLSRAIEIVQFKDVGAHHLLSVVGGMDGIKRRIIDGHPGGG